MALRYSTGPQNDQRSVAINRWISRGRGLIQMRFDDGEIRLKWKRGPWTPRESELWKQQIADTARLNGYVPERLIWRFAADGVQASSANGRFQDAIGCFARGTLAVRTKLPKWAVMSKQKHNGDLITHELEILQVAGPAQNACTTYLLKLLLPRRELDDAMGAMSELYAVQRSRQSLARAQVWYDRQIRQLIYRYALERFRATMRRMTRLTK